MSATIVDIHDKLPRKVANAACVSCHKEWTAILIPGTQRLQCPKCWLYTGVILKDE